MKQQLLLIILSCIFTVQLSAQYVDGTSVKYGNEWIDYSKDYYKISLEQDGIYRITKSELENIGFPVNTEPMSSFSLFHNGEEEYIHTSGDGIMNDDDYIEFYGVKNKNEIDSYTFDDKNDQLNTQYSFITDVAAYFLSFDTGENLRYNAFETEFSSSLPPIETHYMHVDQQVFSDTYTKRIKDQLRYSTPDVTEGFGTGLIKTKIVNFSLSNIYENGPDPSMTIRFGTNLVTHKIKLSAGNTVIDQFNFSGYRVVQEDVTFLISELQNNFAAKVEATDSADDKFTLASLSISYPRTFTFNNASSVSFNFIPSPFDRYFELQDFDLSGGNPVFYDLKTRNRIESEVENGVVRLQSPGSLLENEFKVVNENSILSIKSIESIDFVDYTSMDHDYIILSHEGLFNDPVTGRNYVQEYADYRSTELGGEYNPVVINVEDIYDQFGYGVEEHYLGVRSFLNWTVLNWPSLEYIFIIGKGREYAGFRSDEDKANDPIFFVPTYGFPGSDNLLVTKWGEFVPQVPIGRIAAKSTNDVSIYLRKVIEHENLVNEPQTIENKLWMKRILHLSGGDPQLIDDIRDFLKEMETELENNEYGADVTTFYKTSSDPIETSQSEEITQLINTGLSVITFFGHSAVGVFDLNLEDVTAYDNKGKYPMILSLGCHSGNVHTSASGLSQDFVLTEDKGSIAFYAASSQARVGQQSEIGKEFYKEMGSDLYSRPIGTLVKTILDKSSLGVTGNSWETLLQQLTLHGDPAVRLHSNKGEDYTPQFSSVVHQPEVINAFQDSFEICLNIANLGLVTSENISVNIQHLDPLGTVVSDTSFMRPAPSFLQNYCFTLPLESENLVGKNGVRVFVDDADAIAELPDPSAEMNNQLVNSNGGNQYDFYILNNGAVPVAPKQFAIVTDPGFSLKASTFNAMGEKQSYIFQLDTVKSFNSPLKQQTKIENAVGLIEWRPDISFIPGVVYYWRVSPEVNLAGPGELWNSSSFLYLPSSSEGWNQSHYNQYEENKFDELKLTNNKLDFVSNIRDIRVENKVRNGEDFPHFFYSTGSFWGDAYPFTVGEKIAVVSANEIGRWTWNNPGNNQFGELDLFPNPNLAFIFDPQDQQSRISLVNFIESIEDGHYVFFYTIMPQNNYSPQFDNFNWESDGDLNNGKTIFSVLNEQGATLIDSFKTNPVVPYNFFFRKNQEGLAEDLADDINDIADSTTPVFAKWFTGTETSVKIGPSVKWRKLVWKDELSSIPENDSSYVNIFGVTVDGRDTLLRDHIVEKEINLAQINAEQFPFLKLQYYTFDRLNRTSPDLLFWRVFYDGLPELALDFLDDEVVFNSDTIDQGQNFVLKIPLVNISGVDVDSINVKITLTDQDNESTIEYLKTKPLVAGDRDYAIFEIPSTNLNGRYTISIEANLQRDPEECFYFNNFGLRNFVVRNDLRNPLLDVSFDGRRIMNGDIVSAEPIISIVTKDENKFLLLNDTSTYQLNLRDPDGVESNVYMDDPAILFNPSVSSDDNRSEIVYTPKLEKDGLYSLKVRSTDISGNVSGKQDFSVDFQIINEELVSNVFNYPNPFSDCTQFIFTLTGNELPQDISIKVMTVSGKVVKEINGMELGPLNIGVNRTTYKWDGTDEFGSKLANGVYLYQVVTKKQSGENYEKYDTGTDKFFKNNLGKLVIIR